MPDRMEALEWKIVGVVAGFANRLGPADERRAQGVAHLLLLLVENLLRHFFPGKAKVALGGNHAKTNGAARRKMQWSGVGIVSDGIEEVTGRAVSEV